MRKPDFDHVVAAAVDVSGEREIVVIGSQAILASVEDPPESLIESMELEMLKRELVELDELLGRISEMPVSAAIQEHMTKMLKGIGIQLGLIAE